MRIAISIVLGAIAVAAIVVLGIAQFGGGTSSGAAEAVPFVRDAVDVAGADTPATGPASNARKAPAPAATGETNAPASEPDEPIKPQVSPFSTLNEPAQPAPGQPTTADTPAAPAPAQPEAELRVAPQNAPASAEAVPASLEAQYKSRRLTYNRPPEKLALDRAIDISLIIDTSRQTDAADRLQGLPGTVVERDVELSDTVSAELLGAAFEIQLQTTSTRQKLSPKLANEWRWRVTPKQKGTHVLTLNVYGYAVGSVDAEPLDSYRDQITIEVEPVDEIVTWARGVQPLFAVLAALAGVGSAIFAFLRFREEKKQTTHLTSKRDEP